MKVTLPNVRLAFFNGFKHDKYGRFSSTFLIDPETKIGKKTIKDIEAAIEHVAEEKWGDKAEALLTKLRKQERVCLQDGDEKPEWDGFEGNMFLKASNKSRITITDRDKTPLDETDGKPYSGCYVYGYVEIWAQDQEEGGKRVNASLRGIQFYRDGDAFTGGTPASVDEFEDLSDFDDEEEDDLA